MTKESSGPAGGGGAATEADNYVRIDQSPEFQRLRSSFRRFVFPMTAAFLAWYLLYVVLSAYARGFMGTKVVGEVNVALVFGLLQFVSTFLIAVLYERYARRRLEPLAGAVDASSVTGAEGKGESRTEGAVAAADADRPEEERR